MNKRCFLDLCYYRKWRNLKFWKRNRVGKWNDYGYDYDRNIPVQCRRLKPSHRRFLPRNSVVEKNQPWMEFAVGEREKEENNVFGLMGEKIERNGNGEEKRKKEWVYIKW